MLSFVYWCYGRFRIHCLVFTRSVIRCMYLRNPADRHPPAGWLHGQLWIRQVFPRSYSSLWSREQYSIGEYFFSVNVRPGIWILCSLKNLSEAHLPCLICCTVIYGWRVLHFSALGVIFHGEINLRESCAFRFFSCRIMQHSLLLLFDDCWSVLAKVTWLIQVYNWF